LAWIRTVPLEEASPELRGALEAQRALYPEEYDMPVPSLAGARTDERIVLSHSLLPKALYHAFSEFGELMSPDLPLSRRQHEMIAATVSALNDCFY
jgi:hypothetical protein